MHVGSMYLLDHSCNSAVFPVGYSSNYEKDRMNNVRRRDVARHSTVRMVNGTSRVANIVEFVLKRFARPRIVSTSYIGEEPD